MVFLWAMSQTVLLGKFADLEEQRTTANVERVISALSEKVAFLDGITADWASWDDTYTFIKDANEGYIESNLVDPTFVNNDLNLMLFINAAGEVVFGKAFDLENEQAIPLPQGLQEHLSANGLLVRHRDMDDSVKGLMLLPEGPMLVASRPILTSDEEGPVRGALIMGRYLDPVEVNSLAETTHMSLTVHKFDDSQLPADFQTARSFLFEGTPIFVQVLDSDIIAGYTQISDIYGKPCVVVRVDMPREIYMNAQAAINYFIFSILASILIVCILILWFLERFILSRLTRLRSNVAAIGTSGDLSARVSVSGNDELSGLADVINGMLLGLEQAQSALRESEGKYREVVENASEAIVVIQDGTIVFANSRATELSGYSSEELASRPFSRFVHPDDREIAAERYLKTLDGSQLAQYDYRIVCKSGNIKWFETSSASVIWRGKPAVLAFMTDITKRKQVEVALRQSEERYRTILEDMEEGYYESNLAGNITFVNDSMCRILGYTAEEMIGTNYCRYVDEEDAKQIYKDANSVYRTGKPAKCLSWEFLTKSGETRFIEVAIAPRLNVQGKVIGFRGIFNDVTEREAIEQQVLMTSKLASIGELASGVAHELNNPLTSVMGYAQLLIDSKNVPPEVKSDLNKVYQESQRAAKVVRNLLSFARRRKPEKSYFDVNELVQKTLDLRSYELKTSNIRVCVNLEPDLPEIKADYYQIQQVILNILINAEQALTEVERRGKITVTTSAVEDCIRISIADNGSGIPKQNISRIFDPFFTTKEVGKGTGLGLSVCHGIMTAHHGNVYVESEEGKGAAFIIDLPLVAAEEPDVGDETVVVEKNFRYRRKASENILIIDDESGIRDVLTRIFSENGYRTDSASDVKSALTKLTKNGYDLFIIDLKLPRVSGMRLYEIMKERYPSSAEKVMFITGDTITSSTQNFLDSAGRPYLTKPFNPKVAVELVEEMLRGMTTAKVT
jgi:PAS domain S-box-containing protein